MSSMSDEERSVPVVEEGSDIPVAQEEYNVPVVQEQNLPVAEEEEGVLKPPGGASSDIFGAPDPVQNSPRRVRNNLQSSVFGPSSETPVRNKPGNDTYNRLFGPVESRPASATKNRLKSNITLSNEETIKVSDLDSEVDSKATPRRNPVTGDGMYTKASHIRRSARKRDGNPVTGEGYAATNATNGEETAPANQLPMTNGTSHSAPPQRTRVPPGGFSSGLW